MCWQSSSLPQQVALCLTGPLTPARSQAWLAEHSFKLVTLEHTCTLHTLAQGSSWLWVKDTGGETPGWGDGDCWHHFCCLAVQGKSTGDFVWKTGFGRSGSGHQRGGGNGQIPGGDCTGARSRSGRELLGSLPMTGGSRSRRAHSPGLFSQLCPSSHPVPALAEEAQLCPHRLEQTPSLSVWEAQAAAGRQEQLQVTA